MATGKIKSNFKMPTPSAADRMYAKQQAIRKQKGLPDPSEYKKKLDTMKSEEVEQLDELSPETKSSYVSKAKDQIKQSMPFTKKSDEYRDIAKNFIEKRKKGIAKANEEVVVEMDNRTSRDDSIERRKYSPEGMARQDKEQQKRLKDTSAEMRKKLRLPEPKEVEESFRIGGMGGRGGGRGNIYMYDRNPGPRDDDDESGHVPYVPKTEHQKKLHKALTDLGNKMKETHPKLRESKDSQEYDYEGDMAKSDLRSIIHNAQTLHDMLDDKTNLAEWCQSKITLAEDYISTVTNYMRSEMNEETVQEDINDYKRKIEKNNKNFIAASKRQKNPLTNVHTAQTKQKPVKEEMQQIDEKKKLPGLWANIHAKRKRGESPAKPGDKDYPKTLKIEDADPCWKDYKMVGMKNKKGRKVPNCVPKEDVSTMKKEGVQDDLKADQITTDNQKFPKKMSRKAEIVKKLAKGKEEQFQANPVLDSDVNPQTNKQ